MKIFLLFLYLSLFYLSNINSASAKSIKVFSNINIIDVNDGVVRDGLYLIIEGQRIIHLGKELPKQYRFVKKTDMEGKYVMPGFIDTHAHISLGEIAFKKKRGKLTLSANSSDELSLWNARELLRYGVTYIRNPGGSSKHNLRYRDKIIKNEWIGPEAQVAGEIINIGAFDGLTVNIGKDVTLEEAIIQQKALGVDVIKLYTGLNEKQVESAIKMIHQHNLKAIAHLENVSWTEAANWGIDTLVHAFPGSPKLLTDDERKLFLTSSHPGTYAFFGWYEHINLNSAPMEELYKTLRKHHVHIDPTLIVFRNAFWGDQDEVTNHPELKSVHPELLNNWREFFTFNIGWKEDDFIRARKVWPKVLAFLSRLHEEGISLTIGTDLGNPWVIPGLSFHQEMKIFADAQIPNSAILRMATLTAAEQLGIANDHGSINVGKVANLIFLNKNPLKAIENSLTISQVYLRGKEVSIDSFNYPKEHSSAQAKSVRN